MTLDKYIYEIRELIPEANIDDRLIIRWINLQRAVWLKNELNKNRFIDDTLIQTLKGMKLIIRDQSEVPFISSDFRILRTQLTIPKLIVKSDSDCITDIRNALVLSEKYNYITREQAVYAGNGKFNKRDIFCFKHNNYIWVKLQKNNPKLALLTHLNISGIFEDPTEVSKYFDNYNNSCFDINSMDYPLPETLWVYMREFIVKDGTLNFESTKAEESDK